MNKPLDINTLRDMAKKFDEYAARAYAPDPVRIVLHPKRHAVYEAALKRGKSQMDALIDAYVADISDGSML